MLNLLQLNAKLLFYLDLCIQIVRWLLDWYVPVLSVNIIGKMIENVLL